MTEVADREIKLCCATFYQSDVVRTLLGDVLHPGGLALTRHLGEAIGLGHDDRVLDVACGRGVSAVYLARTFGCHVTGVDYGAGNVAAARAHATDEGVESLVEFRQGDAEGLPFEDGAFDALISECSFCTFPDKGRAATEMARVLRPAGRLGLTDVTLRDTLPEELQSLLSWVACVSGAGPPEAYVATLKEAGFGGFTVEDRQGVLLELVNDVRRKLVGIELVVGLASADLWDRGGNLDLSELDLEEGKRLARQTFELVKKGTVGYTLITARKIR